MQLAREQRPKRAGCAGEVDREVDRPPAPTLFAGDETSSTRDRTQASGRGTVALLLLATLGVAVSPQIGEAQGGAYTVRVVIVADVIAELDSLSARQVGKEQGRCLLGTVVRGDSAGVLVIDSVFVTAIWDPGERHADVASFDPRRPCPERITIGRWHTHLPLKIVRLNDVIVEQGPVPERVACFLSDDDRRTAVDGQRLVHVVQVSPRVRCAWLLLAGKFVPIPW